MKKEGRGRNVTSVCVLDQELVSVALYNFVEDR